MARFSHLGKVEDPALELANGNVYMTNSTRDPSRNQRLVDGTDQPSRDTNQNQVR